VKLAEEEAETVAVEPDAQLVPVGIPVAVQLPDELPQVWEPVWYAGGPITIDEPALTVLVTLAEAEAEEAGEEEEEELELEQLLFSRTEN